MAFFGKHFIFDGVSCDSLELMLYDISGNSQSEGHFAAGVEIVENVVGTKWKPHFYGIKYDEKLKFDIVFGVNQHRIDANKYLDRYELANVSSWLVGHNNYKWLEIEQEDMECVRYKCMITELDIVEYGQIPWALKATVTCDGPYAYMYEHVYEYAVNGEQIITIFNESSHNGYYYPKIEFEMQDGTSFSIANHTDGDRTFTFTDIPDAVTTISVNCDTMVVTCDADLNLYDCCNFNFLRFVKGWNKLTLTGTGVLKIACEFPVNVGG